MLQRLPTEIILPIGEELSSGDLYECVTVCRRLYRTLNPVLYHSVTITTSENLATIVGQLSTNKQVQSHIREIDITSRAVAKDVSLFHTLLDFCPRAQVLWIRGINDISIAPNLALSLQQLPRFQVEKVDLVRTPNLMQHMRIDLCLVNR